MSAAEGVDAVRLARFFDELWSVEGYRVVGLERLSGGASRDTWRFDLLSHDAADALWPLILQRLRPGALGVAGGLEGEATLIRAADAARVPVAAVVAACDDESILGSSFIVANRLDGETLARRLLRDDAWAAARSVLVGQAARALVAIHAIDVDEVPHLRDDDPLHQLRTLLDGLGVVRPAFELALRWLQEHRLVVGRRGVVHGDFRLGNLLVGPDGLAAVLDWELAHIGDPLEDLGWLCVRAWRFGHRAPVAGLGERDELYAAYAAASGYEVDRAAAHWWEVLGTLRWGVICAVQATAHLSGASRSVELAAIGRRAAEVEYDLGRLLGWIELDDADELRARLGDATWSSGPHPEPDAVELLAAVREFLDGPVRDATDGRVAFHARVAARVLDTVARELVSADAFRAAHSARLRSVGFVHDDELAAAIRSGSVGIDVVDVVAESVLDALAVANPDYVTDR